MKTIPYLLIATRFILAPVFLFLACFKANDSRLLLVILMYFGLLTDIFDGIIARKVGVSSEKLRRLDSQTDLIFWLSLGGAAYLLNPELIKNEWKGIILLFAMEALCYIISWLRFGKETCTHAWLSKLWGLSLLLALTYVIGFQKTGWAFDLTVILGLISHVDVILIILLLPKWQYDVPSAYHAWKIRKGKHIRKTVLFN
ncbi:MULTISPECIES: CDP-alcohol phosphatidyltransferase family protein [Chryseobacterium]|uniref:CDP-diacylglycerol--glycerol-3-phosphate 3-phosphatidyltransferase n=1 Tax=Chryseobacterium camelliae TaxID=1265445 RepID=A0ABU0TJV3_9FLAO|nr:MULTISPECIES: CDP-alcohol phosphatidyltransferase family protein [Chryseobacterium]MDT3408816.1 CDP-diacylglycerol--glycerol-3-phosphate 3-phosphatidyltransferase [Pseudacidovorax intermedius]MDQ1097328.1 CDP-diacylglycerol--glycerol-3-phosphate 3-phosphatidyltransferase [Chryseobacterium camelliae]MDQ1101260.1 CDP-diacylglycerol--glycerol-3-phosphate 3-phosphatidyltransferase [Chryseobacterium sp. SORGH_AS_1048]MDR6084705.1 CDP-diacylglycerol--glycerol-3-phosphate 3-phosphatidyltransferase 